MVSSCLDCYSLFIAESRPVSTSVYLNYQIDYRIILSCTFADDMLIKLWDWDKKWHNSQIFEGHTHYVMQIVINPKDNNQFASASLDHTIKVWQLGSQTPNFTLEGHDKGNLCTSTLARLLSISLTVQEVLGSILGPVKSDTKSPVAHHRCDVSSELC